MTGDSQREAVQMMIQRVLDDAPFSMRQIAEEAGVSYDAVRSWATNRRTPRTENLLQLSDALRQRSVRLEALAAELASLAES